MTRMLEIQRLSKRFGPLTAVDDISFTVDRGEVLGFLGPNGAGKSTTMKMVTGFLPPSSGTALVCGHDVSTSPIEVKKRIGYLPEGAPLYEDMTPRGFLSFVADVRGFSGQEKKDAVERAAETINVTEVFDQPIGTLSKGFKRRVGLAQAILHDPEVLILDEPTDGLDPNQKHEVRELISRMAKDKSIIISTHILEEVDAVCTRAIIIARGKIVADGSPDELEARSKSHNAVSIRLNKDCLAAVEKELRQISGVDRVEVADQQNGSAYLNVLPQNGDMILPEISAHLRKGDFGIEEIALRRGHLDDVFRQITMSN